MAGRRGWLAGCALAVMTAAGAVEAGELRGAVVDAGSDARLQGATVRLLENGRTAVSQRDGGFTFLDLPAGEYTAVADFVGYEPVRRTVRVEETGTAELVLTLGPTGDVAEIVVTGTRAAQAEALQVQRSATQILNALSADDLGQLPDNNAADALQRLPGVTATIDQGESRYVVIRGIDSNLVNVTVNGQIFPGPEGGSRRVALDTFPSDVIERLEVIKALTPDLDANAIGGTVNIVTPSAFDRPNGFARLSGRVGYNDIGGDGNFAMVGSIARLFGPDDQFGGVLSASFSIRDYESDNYEATGLRDVGGTILPANRIIRDYRIVRERTGLVGNLEWRPSEGLRLYANNTYARYADDEQRDTNTFEYALGTLTRTGPATGSYTGGRAAVELRDRRVIQRLYNSSLGGAYETGAFTFDFNATFARAEEETPKRIDYEFRSATNAFPNSYDASGLFIRFNAPLLSDPRRYPFRRLRQRTDDVVEDTQAYTANLRYGFADRPGFLQAGVRYVTRDKTWDRENVDFVGLTPGNTFLLSDVSFPGEREHFGDIYDFGPTIQRSLVRAYFANNLSRFAFDANGSLSNSLVTDFDAREDISAGYVMGQYTLAGVEITAGVRVEHTEADYGSFDVQRRGGAIIGFPRREGSTDYTQVLPDVLARYDRGDFVFRAAYTNSLGRPNYTDIVPRRDFDAVEVSPGNFQGAFSEGNPALEPFASENFDLSAEYYMRPAGIISIGLFHKNIDNPVFTRQTDLVNVDFEGRRFSRLTSTRPENAESGTLTGVELNYQQQFTFLPGFLEGFGVNANLTFVESEAEVIGRADELPFFRQSDELANAALFYERDGLEARIAATHRSPYLEILIGPGFDVYVDERTQWDFRVSYDLTDQLQINADVLNITGESLRLYSGEADRVVQDERYGYSVSFGISARF